MIAYKRETLQRATQHGGHYGQVAPLPGSPDVSIHAFVEGGASGVDTRLLFFEAKATLATVQRAEPSREQFRILADWWHDTADALSSSDAKSEHPAYRRIVAL